MPNAAYILHSKKDDRQSLLARIWRGVFTFDNILCRCVVAFICYKYSFSEMDGLYLETSNLLQQIHFGLANLERAKTADQASQIESTIAKQLELVT